MWKFGSRRMRNDSHKKGRKKKKPELLKETSRMDQIKVSQTETAERKTHLLFQAVDPVKLPLE